MTIPTIPAKRSRYFAVPDITIFTPRRNYFPRYYGCWKVQRRSCQRLLHSTFARHIFDFQIHVCAHLRKLTGQRFILEIAARKQIRIDVARSNRILVFLEFRLYGVPGFDEYSKHSHFYLLLVLFSLLNTCCYSRRVAPRVISRPNLILTRHLIYTCRDMQNKIKSM